MLGARRETCYDGRTFFVTPRLIMAEDPHTPPAAFIANRHRNPLEGMDLKPAASYTMAGIFAIFATLIFAGVLAFQIFEWNFYEFM